MAAARIAVKINKRSSAKAIRHPLSVAVAVPVAVAVGQPFPFPSQSMPYHRTLLCSFAASNTNKYAATAAAAAATEADFLAVLQLQLAATVANERQ